MARYHFFVIWVLLSLSDQQMILAVAFQSVWLIRIWTMVHYHFFMMWMLSLLATITHPSMLLALVNDFKRDRVMRWLLYFFILSNVCPVLPLWYLRLHGQT